MRIKVVHILSTLDKINFGIWNAALFGSGYLRNADIHYEAWVCTDEEKLPEGFPDIDVEYMGVSPGADTINDTINKRNVRATDTVIVSHGVWLAPSSVGYQLNQKGFRWIYSPHGMLEPWSIAQNYWKKKIYFWMFEKKYARKATRIRAVSSIEQSNLNQSLKRPVELIENGVKMPVVEAKPSDVTTVLFLGRLHYKKGISLLVEAWVKVFEDDPHFELVIAGPDEGELATIRPDISGNITYVGSVYGEKKAALLQAAHYFALPSFSEGFPTSVVEAMSYGAIPLISSGCNIPEVFEADLGFLMEPDAGHIESVLRELSKKPVDAALSERNRRYAEEKFSESPICERLRELYLSTLNQSI